jgi:hypothetical protein
MFFCLACVRLYHLRQRILQHRMTHKWPFIYIYMKWLFILHKKHCIAVIVFKNPCFLKTISSVKVTTTLQYNY